MPHGKEACFVQKHALAEVLFGEILISYECDFLQFEAISASNDVFNCALVLSFRASSEIDIYVKVTLVLEVVSQIAGSLDQEVVIHGALLIDRHVTSKNTFRHFCFYRGDVDFRPWVDGQDGLYATARRVKLQIFQFDVSSKAILFLIFPEDCLNA